MKTVIKCRKWSAASLRDSTAGLNKNKEPLTSFIEI